MNKLANRKDVARLAGVSEATVSRVFNNIAPLREETKQKVLQAAKELHYYPNVIAQNFAKGKSNNIGVIVPYLPKVNLMSTHYFSELVSGIGAKLGESGYGLLLLFQTPDQPKDYVQLFQSQRVDGCIILGAKNTPNEIKALEDLHQQQLPYCLINQTFSEHTFHFIDGDHVDGSYQATTSLLNKGFERIIFLNGPKEFSNSIDRLVGYRKALQHKGIPFSNDLIFEGNYSRKSGYMVAEQIHSFLHTSKAIFAANDRMAIGLMQGLNERGLLASQDYFIIGYDNSEISRMTSPPLSTVNVPLYEMGQMAAEKVLNCISHGDNKNTSLRLPVTLIERQSSRKN
ncbi:MULTISPECIES: LacI family DNA-binding transcriptional regulator [Bacillaceae]|uniref:LacI family DNA-binding transcriptional regulator n=1 Tax=Bacillaceae TaxID=186817 RepID=UPI000BFD4BEC|nr:MULTISPECIES: LacI family DNA-binding transcriptional regulator [Bacillaceae]PGT84678.1 LacI family transcriptional regulator [Bacillus sp. AFS040349]UGB32140.1 LacI family transcriptional regulator [Metabacillus sp. B2-18]